ncbi:hypothetical protein ASPBRDRAFT_30156 [Aspergillus brasiliensis CBS 101740]|uniref:Transcription factor domain-containing protein n=1 Tax=Aspergillus brasiliensis (strain CBS 101740 / IMI 381727 / IBT 21946) TaxID=767769 RepID=A0A1L9UJB3_ASPBC|nr:hypothetical protein ASPBRDRAFT_30156 [Aspergillus brasiliensis CBS 101740]
MPSPWVTMMETTTHHACDGDIPTAFFDATVRLLQIVGRSLATQYGQDLRLGDDSIDESTAIQAASTVRQGLRRWASSLPSSLSLCDAGSVFHLGNENTMSNRMRVILTLRYHFVNILIHRPLLCATLRYLTVKESPPGRPLPYRIQLAVAEAHECILSAEKTIEIVHAVINAPNPSHTNLDVWFFTLFHAVEALDKLDKDNYLVYNCARFIARLSQPQSDQDAKQDHCANGPAAQAGSEVLTYEQLWPTVGLPALSDPNIVSFSRGDLFGHSFGEFSLSLDQLNSTY